MRRAARIRADGHTSVARHAAARPSPHSWDNASSNSHDANQAPPMLRLTELTLPIEHPPEALAPAIQQRLRLPDGALLGFTVFKRSYDARKKYADLSFVYTVDCELRSEEHTSELQSLLRNS